MEKNCGLSTGKTSVIADQVKGVGGAWEGGVRALERV